jgi:STE24 endopeptidase
MSMNLLSAMLAPLSASAIWWIVVVTLALDAMLSNLANYLNYHALSPSMPLEFEGVYDAAEYAQSQRYTRAKTVYKAWLGLFDLALLIAFWSLDGFDVLDQAVLNAFPDAPVSQGLLYMFALVMGSTVISIPWKVYETFVLEERFGFNKTTARTFVTDRVKELALLVVIGPILGGGLLYYFIHAGAHGWLYAWGFVAAMQALLLLVAPIWIIPLFMEFTPLPDGELKSAIEKYAASVGFAFSGIFEVDASSRSSHTNAFFTGFGATKRIALFDTLIKSSSTTEILAVLAHEVGHEKRGHIKRTLAFSLVQTLVIFYLMSFFLPPNSYPPLFAAFSVSRPSVHVGLVLFELLLSPVSALLTIAMTMESRSNEFEADRYSIETYGDSEAMVSALKKLSKSNLDNLTPHPLKVFLDYTHPPILERIRAIRELTAVSSKSNE